MVMKRAIFVCAHPRMAREQEVQSLGHQLESKVMREVSELPSAPTFRTDPVPTPAQRNTMMLILVLAVTCSAMDRSIIATVIEPIKAEFGLSDGQLGFITGMAYSLANAAVGIPLGLLADRVNRRNMMAAALVLWSLMTAFCGLAQNYAHLVLARMGVGASEAGGQSTALSMTSDLYPPHRRATAVAILYMAFPLGSMLAAALGGVVAATYGWRAALLIAAVPGFVLAIAMMMFGRDPRNSTNHGERAERAPPIGEVVRFIISQRAMLHLMAALALTTLVVAGQAMFAFSFFMRYHSMNLLELGPLLGAGQGIFGVASLLAGGLLADRVGRKDPRVRLWVVVAALVAVTPIMLLSYFTPKFWALGFYLAHILAIQIWIGPGISAVQNLARPRMRASVAAIMYTLNGVVGYGLGPVAVGVLSDTLAPHVGEESLRIALVIVTFLGLWAAIHYHKATRTLRGDLARVGEGAGE
jgi:predicted MFS family arabinose efflux permease